MLPGELMSDYTVVIEKDEDGYFVASVPSIPGCHTQAKTLDSLMKRIREAVELCIEEGIAAPRQNFVGVQTISVDKYARSSPSQG